MDTWATPHMSSWVAGTRTTSRPVVSLENRPSSPSCVSGVGRCGAASATFAASSANRVPQRPSGLPMIS
ncbi:hypothetical protein SR39_14415 [Methylobacterium radiotolerans]|nr:hypothetical protein SR39_14415 [Methylobacterium radiotolerans]